MKYTETKPETIERERVVATECDLCHTKKTGDGWWGENAYDVAETQVSCRWGSNYPEGGWGSEIEVDICLKCFKQRVVPWLKEQGVAVVEKEWEW